MKKQIVFLILILLLSGCATKKHAPETDFFAPVFNEENVLNPPAYPNNLLNGNITKVPRGVPVLGQAIWLEDNLIVFSGIRPGKPVLYEDNKTVVTGTRSHQGYTHTYTFNTINKEFLEITDLTIKAEINNRFKSARLDWIEDTTASRTASDIAADISMNVLEVLTASLFNVLDPDHYSKTKTYLAYCSNIEGTNKIKLIQTFSSTGTSVLFGINYYIGENKISDISFGDINYLSDDGSKIITSTLIEDEEAFISGVQVIDVKTGELRNSTPIVTQDKSATPRLVKYSLNPSLSKLLLIYQDNTPNNPLSYSIDIVDYLDK